MAKEVMLFDFSKQGFLSLGRRLQMKYVYSKNLLVHELKFPFKKIKFLTVLKFCTPTQAAIQGKCCLLMHQKS